VLGGAASAAEGGFGSVMACISGDAAGSASASASTPDRQCREPAETSSDEQRQMSLQRRQAMN
jgi:hypothetical protein